MSKEDFLRKKIARLEKSQQEAEHLLEEKSREIYALNKNLEQQIEERTRELKEATEQAISASRAKSQFLANMSHEIRTPINGMLGFIGLLEKSNLSSTQREQLSIVSKSGLLLLSIINDILEFSKIEAGKLSIEMTEMDIKKCVEDIVDVMSQQVFDKNLELPSYVDLSLPESVIGDEARIRQVLLNLIGNAVKFTPTGEISVSVHKKTELEDGRFLVEFSVQDSGVGISTDKIGTIFQAFEQADVSDTRKYGGTGLGLTISRQIIEAMGGKIEVVSEESKGSKFSFTIPMSTVQNANKPQALESGQRAQAPLSFSHSSQVALVINNSTSRNNIQRLLSAWGANCQIYYSLSEVKWPDERANKFVVIDHHFVGSDDDQLQLLKLSSLGVKILIITSPKSKSILFDKFSSTPSSVNVIAKPVKRDELFWAFEAPTNCFTKASEQTAQPQSTAAPSQLRILLVEDNLVNQQVALAMLAAHGYEADVAGNGAEAVKKFSPDRYDLILMDCQMPVMDGFEATREIRKLDQSVTIIAMTANAFKQTKEQCFEVGMNDFITKPVNDDHLAEVIHRNMLQKKQKVV